MKTYVVGGAVRDELLGLPVKDRDHVVVGATPEEMAAQGFRPVGKDFPVFLHPTTQEEHALARTERKSGRGYKGFTVLASPEVTLEEDLKRRDLTINAMARAPDGALIDPFGGKKDLEARVLRHVSDAFAEDPVRILRVARFAARFAFSVHPSTMALMRSMVSSGETDHLVPERVWQEFAKGLDEKHPGRMLDVLAESGFLSRNLPEITVDREALRLVGVTDVGVPIRFCVLTWAADENRIETLCGRLKVPNEVRELAETAARNRRRLDTVESASPGQLLELLKSADAFRRPQRFAELLDAAKMANPKVDTMRAGRALDAANTVDAGEIAKQSAPGDIAANIDEARRNAIQQVL